MVAGRVTKVHAHDVRFPTSLGCHGSDAMHTDPDYSCAYVVISTDTDFQGHGLTFTIGRGTEVVVAAVRALAPLVEDVSLDSIFTNFGQFWRKLTSDSQLRWIGPEKGVIHLATAGVINALWDLWGKIEGKPVWKLLADMSPQEIVSLIDFRYISDLLTKEEAIGILEEKQQGKVQREKELLASGYPAYTTACGWLGYTDEKIKQLCQDALKEGFKSFKVKVGRNLADDKRRLQVVRSTIGEKCELMVDANQYWDVKEAIYWMKELSGFGIHWIEEPTSPDDILGHATISKALAPLGIGVATGEQCHNRVMFKQFLQSGAMQFCQIDSCRLGGVNEILAVILMAAKCKVPVCPHAGGVGLCELVQHLSFWDYIAVSGTKDNREIEYVSHLHEHFKSPVLIQNGCYMPPQVPGYGCEMWESSIEQYSYPNGSYWRNFPRIR
ncbi:mitochondrial enolase superfamily member 1 [Rhipicephalus sanguineus]|uniref:mitochondrial enolase superfamily member 1 n=1 Tax=Rhipicephalus sanguineus TaxID=34632 RepID=UPI0018950AF6|nr:mitochondrial enolase superfamily member 1 [Rhipicephalus sanguineus]